ncbi:MAG: helix-turn-helix domain-containing protein [Ruminococcus sp.]|nr:helix-turn-helix domain-containing protein [Ruminococcus sp.]
MRLKDIREDRDITQSEIAAYLHVRQNTYSQYENGKRSLPVEMLVLLAEFFETS